jgi:pimeloyl-ACP methyl ester carboxylesterase
MKIDALEPLRLGDTTEWIRVRGADPANPANPVLLLIQQGPGLPMLNEVRRFERTLGLERDFTVVYWDQRGCGRSLRGPAGAGPVTLDVMARDTVSLLELLRDRFGRPAIVAGFSMGATIGAQAAARRPDLVATLVATAIDIDGPAAAGNAWNFAIEAARRRGNGRAVRQLEAIGPPPHLTAKQFGTRVRWVSEYGGASAGQSYGSIARDLLISLVRSPDYAIGDVVRTFRGASAPPASLLADIAHLDLLREPYRLAVPVVTAHGRLDQVAPGDATQRWFDALEAPRKELVWFAHSAHTPQLDEPVRFRELLLHVRAQLAAGA